MKKELGKWILDVTKYVATAGVIAPLLTNAEGVWWYLLVVFATIAVLLIGLWLVRDDERKEKIVKKSKIRRG